MVLQDHITCNKMMAYSNNAPNTKNMQQITQDCIAFKPSAFGEFVVVVLNIFTYYQLKQKIFIYTYIYLYNFDNVSLNGSFYLD